MCRDLDLSYLPLLRLDIAYDDILLKVRGGRATNMSESIFYTKTDRLFFSFVSKLEHLLPCILHLLSCYKFCFMFVFTFVTKSQLLSHNINYFSNNFCCIFSLYIFDILSLKSYAFPLNIYTIYIMCITSYFH